MILSMCIKACSREVKWETLVVDVDVQYRILSIWCFDLICPLQGLVFIKIVLAFCGALAQWSATSFSNRDGRGGCKSDGGTIASAPGLHWVAFWDVYWAP